MKTIRLKKNCNICNKEFFCSTTKEKTFCSIDCYRIAQRRGDYKKESKRIHTCSYCGKKISNKSKKLKRNGSIADNIFCNRECYDLFRRLNTERECKQCGKKFIAISSKKNAQFCNDKCRRLYFTEKTRKDCVICEKSFLPIKLKNGRLIQKKWQDSCHPFRVADELPQFSIEN